MPEKLQKNKLLTPKNISRAMRGTMVTKNYLNC